MTGRTFRSGQSTGPRPENNQIQISAHNGKVPKTTGVIVKMALWSGEEGRKAQNELVVFQLRH